MEQPILFKDIEINERKFRFTKMDARTGSYMLFRLIRILAPIFKDENLGKEKSGEKTIEEKSDLTDDINLTELISSVCSLEENEFRYIQDNCLQVVKEILPGGTTNVLNKNGVYGILDIEFDTWLLMNLTIQSLLFNVSGFFEGSPLSSMFRDLNISQLISKI